MKKLHLIVACCLLGYGTFAQANSAKQLTQYLFPDFAEGSVLQKSGTVTKTILNYNTLTQEMIFKQADQLLALDKLYEIDTVFLSNKKFIPAGEVFYEVGTSTAVALFIQHASDIIPPGGETGYGKSQTTAITSVTDLKSSGRAYALSLPDEYVFKNKTTYLLRKDGNFITVKNIKDVKKVFPGKENLVDDFVKTNKISFKDDADVIKLIEFCNAN